MPDVDDLAKLLEARVKLVGLLGELIGPLDGLEDGDIPPDQMAAIELAMTETEWLVSPPLAPMLMLRRVTKERIREWISRGIDPDLIRSKVRDLAERTAPGFADEQRPLVGPLLDRCLDEVLSEQLEDRGA